MVKVQNYCWSNRGKGANSFLMAGATSTALWEIVQKKMGKYVHRELGGKGRTGAEKDKV